MPKKKSVSPNSTRHAGGLRNLQGTWAFRSLEIDGNAMPESMLQSSSLQIAGDRFRLESPEATYAGQLILDLDAVPHRIDLDFHAGPEAGNRCEGLFELDGDRLRLCLGLAGAARPRAFATSPGSGHALEELERVDRARPEGLDAGARTATRRKPSPARTPEAPEFDQVTPIHEKLQGEWIPRELINSGVPLQESYLPFGTRTQTGTETKVVFGGQTMVHAKLRFHEDASPIEVDYFNLSGRAAGSITRGIFRWDGEDAVFCMAEPEAERPTDFTSDLKSKRIYSRWRRK